MIYTHQPRMKLLRILTAVSLFARLFVFTPVVYAANLTFSDWGSEIADLNQYEELVNAQIVSDTVTAVDPADSFSAAYLVDVNTITSSFTDQEAKLVYQVNCQIDDEGAEENDSAGVLVTFQGGGASQSHSCDVASQGLFTNEVTIPVGTTAIEFAFSGILAGTVNTVAFSNFSVMVNDELAPRLDGTSNPQEEGGAVISVEALESGSGLDGVYYAAGVHEVDDFPAAGTQVLITDGSGSFSVAAGGTYTLFAADAFGNESLITVDVNTYPQFSGLVDQSIQEDNPLAFEFDVSDAESSGGALAVTAVSSDENIIQTGSININNIEGHISLMAAPVSDANGSLSITIRVTDEGGLYREQAVNVEVTAVNDVPVANPDSAQTDEDTPVEIFVLTNDTNPDHGTLSVDILSAPESGLAEVNPGNTITYTPAGNYHGTQTFTYQVTDPVGEDTASAQVTVIVDAVNDAPNVQNDSGELDEDSSLSISVLVNDDDVEGDAFSISSYTQPSHGAVVLDGGQESFTYTPMGDYFGSDAFSYTVAEDAAPTLTATAWVYLTVKAVNDAPVPTYNANISTDEDTSTTEPLTATDVDLDELTFYVKPGNEPASGNLTLIENGYTYDPDADFEGTDDFIITVSDSTVEVDCAITVTVSAVNDAPVPTFDTDISTDEDTPVTKTLTADDADGDDLLFYVKAENEPSNGEVVIGTGQYTYTPDLNYHGGDSFVMTVFDGTVEVDVPVSVNVVSVNDDPVPTFNENISTDEDTLTTQSLTATDDDGDDLSFYVKPGDEPASGDLTLIENGYTYDPHDDFEGTDDFIITVWDGTVEVDCPITVTVNAVNDAPVPTFDTSISTDEDTPVTKSLTADDADGDDPLFYVKPENEPSNGEVVVGTGQYTYTPDLNYHGSDSFVMTVFDGTVEVPVPVNVNVVSVNDDPVPTYDEDISTDEDTPTTESLTATDDDGDDLFFYVKPGNEPANGDLTLIENGYTYDPHDDFNGTDNFTITVWDGTLEVDCAITVTVDAVNDAPVPTYDTDISTDEDTPTTESLTATDVDPDTLSYYVNPGNEPVNGDLTLIENGYTYDPHADFNGTDSFSITVFDGTLEVDCPITVTVNPVNDAPVPTFDANISTDEDTLTTQSLTATDVDPDTLSYYVNPGNGPASGDLTLIENGYTYDPHADFNGTDNFTITVFDGTLEVDCAITVTVNPVNDAPEPTYDASISTNEDTLASKTLTATDVDLDALSYYVKTGNGPAHGALELIGGGYNYMPVENYNGPDNFTITVGDGSAEVDCAVTVTVNAVNDTPVAVDDSKTTLEDTNVTVSVLTNDSDVDSPEGDFLTVNDITVLPAHGTATISGNSVIYDPADNYFGSDEFTYQVIDTGGLTAEAVVSISVTSVNDDPIPEGLLDEYTTDEDTAITINFDLTDVETPTETLTMQVVSGDTDIVSQNRVTISGLEDTNPAASVHINPLSNKNGDVDFTLRTSDGFQTAVYSFTLHVTPVNDAPVVRNDAINFVEDTVAVINISSQLMNNDTDIDNTQAQLIFDGIISTTTDGLLVDNGDGTLTYTPSANFDDSDTFVYRVKDPDGATDTATVTLNAVAENDPPTISEIDDQIIEEDGTVVVNFTVGDFDLETEAELNTLMITTSSTNPDLLDANNMRVTGSGEYRTFTAAPLDDKHGSVTVVITVSDGIAEDSEDFLVTITPVPDNPKAEDDFFYVQNVGSYPIDPVANDWDADGDTDLTPAIVSGPLHGSLAADGDAYIYTANESFEDSDSFTYTVTDSTSRVSNTATVTLSADPCNQPPAIGTIENQIIFEDDSGSVIFTIEDENDNLDQVTVSSSNTTIFPEGSLVLSNVGVDYTLDFTPAADTYGRVVLTVSAEDSCGNVTNKSFTVRVVPINDLPTAVDDSVTTNEDNSVTFSVLTNDEDKETSTANLILRKLLTTPSHGRISGIGGNQLRYTPHGDYNGSDSFTYEMSDVDGGVASATVYITINSVNDAPEAYSNYLTTILAPGDTLDNINVIGNDTDPDLPYDVDEEIHVTRITSQPACGTAYVNPDGTVKYEAFDGGGDCAPAWMWITYEIEDHYGATDTAQISIPVDDDGTNLPPRVSGIWRSIQEDAATITIDLSGYAFDPDGDTLTYDLDLASPPDTNLGTATIAGSIVSYTPGPDKNGTYSQENFHYTVSDGNATVTGTIYVEILAVNDPPTISVEAASIVEIPDQSTVEDQPVTVDFYIDDVDKDDVGTTFGIDDIGITVYSDDNALIPPSGISYTRNDATGLVSLTLTPDEQEFGSLNITVVVTDSIVYTTDTFLVEVAEVNDPPVATDHWVTTDEDAPLHIHVIDYQANVDGDIITISQGSTAPGNGSISFDQIAGEVIYTPDPDFNGSDTFDFVLTDEGDLTDSGTVYVTVNPVNDPPDVYNLAAYLETPEDTSVGTTFNVADIDTDLADMVLSAVSSDPALIDTFTFDKSTDGSGEVALTIDPAANQSGTVTIDVTASDVDKSDTESFTFKIYAINDPPVVQDDAVEIDEDNSITINVIENDTDIEDPDTLYVVSNTAPLLLSDGTAGHGSVVNNNDGTLTYTPGNDRYDDVFFTYEVSDSGNLRGTGTVTVTINSVNDAPRASNDSRSIVEDTSVAITVLANDSDVEGDDFSVSAHSDPLHGSVEFDSNTQSFTYTPEWNYTGSDSFTYTVAEDDDPSMTDTATVSISISAEDDYPIVSTTEPWVMYEDTTDSFNVNISDAETASANLLITFTSLDTDLIKSHNVILQGSGTSRTVQLTPVAQMNGSLQLQVDVNDGALLTTEYIDIIIMPVNDPPVAQDYTAEVDEDSSVSGVVVVKSDIDLLHEGDSHTYSLNTDGAHGGAVVAADGSWTYTPDPNYNGEDEFTVLITDLGGATAVSTIEVTVYKVNDTPQVTSTNVHTIDEDTNVTDTIVVLDPDVHDGTDPDSYTIQITTDVADGEVVLDGLTGEYTYTPDENFNGSDSFTVKVTDEHDAETSKTVNITVDPVNDPPVAEDDGVIEIAEDGDVDIDVLANDDDIDLTREGDNLTISEITGVDNGTVLIAPDGKSLNFDADPDWYGTEVFTYTVKDKENATDQGEVTVTVNAVNDGPHISDVPNQTIAEDGSTGAISFSVTDVDDDDGGLQVTRVTSNGTVIPLSNIVLGGSGSNRTVTVTPIADKNTWNKTTSLHEPVTITLTVSDGELTDTDTFTITVTPDNDAPVPADDEASVDEDHSVVISVLANDTDVDRDNEGDALTIFATSNVDNGNVTIINSDTELRFTPDHDWFGTEIFTYTVQDENGARVDAQVEVTVNPVNDAPLISDVSNQTIMEDSTTGALSFSVTDVDNEDGTLQVTATTGNGTVIPQSNIVLGGSGSARTVTVTPDADMNTWDEIAAAHEPVTITLTVSDGSLTASDTFDVTVTPLNDGPLAVNDSDTVAEDGSKVVDVLANDEDVDLDYEGDDLVVTGLSAVDNATVTIAPDGKSITFAPDLHWNGTEVFTYYIKDQSGTGLESSAEVTMTVTAQNDPPDAVNDSAAVDEDDSVNIDVLFNDTDVDLSREGDDLTIQSADSPNHGTVTIRPDGKMLTYTPNNNWSGTDTFTYTITDQDETDTATVTVTVYPVDDDPAANDDDYAIQEDAGAVNFNVLLNDTDADLGYGDALEIVQITSAPAHGTAVIDSINDRIVYTPYADYNGSDSFIYQIKDNQDPVVNDTARVDIIVESVNDLPVVTSTNNHTIQEDNPASGSVTVSDVDTGDSPDPDSHAFTIDTDAQHGTVSLNEDTGAYTYTPDADYNGADEFIVLVTDERGGTVTQTVTITIGAINDAPVVDDASFNTPEDVPVVDTIDAVDPDVVLNGDKLTFSVINSPVHGTLILDDETGDFTYTPHTGYNGADSFTVEVEDLAGEKDQALISLYVNYYENDPDAVDDWFTIDEDSGMVSFDVLANDQDSDLPYGDVLDLVSIISAPSKGTASINSITKEVEYTPAANANGADSFVYQIKDNQDPVVTDSATVNITIEPINDTPVITSLNTTAIDEDSIWSGVVTFTDPDLADTPADTHLFYTDAAPLHGRIDLNQFTGQYLYTPAGDYNGTDEFTLRVTDSKNASDSQTITITMNWVDDDPVANDDAYRTVENATWKTLDVIDNDTDADLDYGDALVVTQILVNPTRGTVTINSTTNTLSYKPQGNFHGTDTFVYEIRDNQNPQVTDSATVTIKVSAVDDSASGYYFPNNTTTNPLPGLENTGAQLMALLEDNAAKGAAASGGDSYTLDPNHPPSNGVVTVNPITGEFTYVPNANFNGEESFTILIHKDGEVIPQVVELVILPVNDQPTSTNQYGESLDGAEVRMGILADDVDIFTNDDKLVYSLLNEPESGTLVLDAQTGDFVYTPQEGFVGAVTFTIRAQDQQGEYIDCLVSIDVKESGLFGITSSAGGAGIPAIPAGVWWALIFGATVFLVLFFFNVRISYMKVKPDGSFKKVSQIKWVISGKGDQVVLDLKAQKPASGQVNEEEVVLLRSFVMRFKSKTLVIKRDGKMIKMVKVEATQNGRMVISLN